MDAFLSFVQSNKVYFDVANALSSVMNLVAWCVALVFLGIALRRNRVTQVGIGPFIFRMKEDAVAAATTAARAWQAEVSGHKVDVPRIRKTVERAFSPEIASNLTGKSVLWVDDNPINNELAVRALRKFNLDIEQATSTEAALTWIQRRPFDLVISDMGRGNNMRAGYELLEALRNLGNQVPFFIFASSDRPEFRREARERGAQLSTNDMLELIDYVVKYLGTDA
jgi:CheY-like chemotaxis protein